MSDTTQQKDNAKPAAPLLGREHLTEQERIEFLQSARDQEKRYDEYVANLKNLKSVNQYPHEQLPGYGDDEFQFNRGRNLEANVEISLRGMERNREKLEHEDFSNREQERNRLMERIESHKKRFEKDLAKFEQYYEDHPIMRRKYDESLTKFKDQAKLINGIEELRVVQPNDSAFDKKQDMQFDAKEQRVSWHKRYVDPNQPLQFTEAFAHANNILGNGDKKLPEFKPHVGDPLQGMEALYTNVNENTHLDTSHKDINLHPHQQPLTDSQIKHASKYALLAMGLLGATEAAKAAPGDLSEKLSAAGNALKDMALDAVPGVTYAKKMQMGQYEDAALDAASYLPLGDISGIARSPQAQAVLDALPKNREQLMQMQADNTEAPINRHLAEYRLVQMDAKNEGEIFKGLSISSRLTDLAEMKLVLQAQWQKNAELFSSAVRDSGTNWSQFISKNPELTTPVTIHLAAERSGQPAAFVQATDANLAASIARGAILQVPEMVTQKNHLLQEDVSLAR